MTSEVVAIHIAHGAGQPMEGSLPPRPSPARVCKATATATAWGFYSATPTDPGARELTLIAEEALAAVLAETGIALSPAEHRRNITTRGIDLDRLLGKRFRIGEVVCEGVRACPPCNHLEEVTGKAVMPPLVHRGGLRARIVTGGTIRVGDQIAETRISYDCSIGTASITIRTMNGPRR